MPNFHVHMHEEKLKCPYKGCGKSFEKPTVLTDTTTMPRETYYACPYCMSKLDIIVENMKLISVKPTEYPKVFESPAKCAHHFGFLNAIPKEGPLPDECLICPKVLQCSVKKQ
jgi:DNA-directed RNA polymerase subunit RPC12/RpoP